MDPESILIVDDDRDVAATLREYLTREGYAVATAETGAQGLDRLRQGGIALLLVDLHLPDMDGTLVMRAAQQLTGSPEVVVITGYATVDSAVQAVGGTAGYLMKPIELPRLGGIVRRVFDRRRFVRENNRLQVEMAARLKEQGFEVLRALKADPATPKIPVIILSNLGQESDVKQAMEAGAAGYFVKANLSLQDLVKRVGEAVGSA